MDHHVPTGPDQAEAETEVRSDVTHRRPGTSLPVQIGPYRIVELLGKGGMGTVHLAEQTQPFRRRVAVTVIEPAMVSSLRVRAVVGQSSARAQAGLNPDSPWHDLRTSPGAGRA
jgi:serine/threonine protein kinase